MPSVQFTETVKYEFEWEDLHRPSPYLDSALAIANRTRGEFIAISKAYRPISGKKRVAKYKEKQANKATTSDEPQAEVMQSITATPVLKHASFEELRVECYNQSTVAKGSKPEPVDAVANPADVIPPLFDEFKDVTEEGVDDVAMEG